MKEKILNWFKTDRDFESGKQLYMSHGANLSFKNVLNRAGKTRDNYNFLCYELAKLAGIKEGSYKKMLEAPIENVNALPEEDKKVDINTIPIEELAKQIELIVLEDLEWNTVRALVKQLELKPAGRKKEHFIAALVEAKTKKFVSSVPDNVKRSIKLREEFPFLASKTCPEVLKILVNDMLTAYETYIVGHQKLVESANESDMLALSESVVENYLENREIWDELNHYKENNELLGKHAIFAWMDRKAEIEAMQNAELVKLRDQLTNKIPRTKKQIVDEPEHKETAKRKVRIEQFEMELELVNDRLGLDD
jgi:hypothetical protein